MWGDNDTFKFKNGNLKKNLSSNGQQYNNLQEDSSVKLHRSDNDISLLSAVNMLILGCFDYVFVSYHATLIKKVQWFTGSPSYKTAPSVVKK